MVTRILFVQEVPETGCVLILAYYRGWYKDRLDAPNDLNFFEQQRQRRVAFEGLDRIYRQTFEVHLLVHTGF